GDLSSWFRTPTDPGKETCPGSIRWLGSYTCRASTSSVNPPSRTYALALLLRGRIAKILPRPVRQPLQPFDAVGMLLSDAGRFAGVHLQVEQGQRRLGLAVDSRRAVGAARFAGQRLIRVGEVQLPRTAAHRLQMAVPVKVEGVVRTAGVRLAREQ